jgi:hypothetical protein
MKKLCKTLTAFALGSFFMHAASAYAADNNIASAATSAKDPACITADCLISCVDPTSNNVESQKVIDTLEILEKSLTNGDYGTFKQYIDESCTTFDQSRHLIAGKDAVVQSAISRQSKITAKGTKPLTSYTIEHPYAQVLGNTAIVTFVAICQTGGKHHGREACKGTDVFVKDGDKWKEVHYRGSWRRVG